MRKPRRLGPGARLAVVSPASPFADSDLERGLEELRVLGFEPIVDPRIRLRERFVSGPASVRADVFMNAIDDPRVDGIIGVRGGYGSVQILPHLVPARIASARKPFIGYSDLTSLLQFVTCQCGLVSFHGPTVVGRLSGGVTEYDPDSLVRVLTRAEPLGELAPEGLTALRGGDARGVLLGGTVTQLCASLGTPYAFEPPSGFVLLVDDVNERPYRLDRMLTQLRLAGILERASAIVFGELPRCDEPGGLPTARDVVADALAGFPGPVLWGFPTGHTIGPAWTVPLGVEVRVVAGETRSLLVIEESAVEAA